ncbi:pyridoxamine 5'-phosphate oxidase [bacterium]|nr:pyridoxamine 5'-phosphate oxidase [bacterium]
MSALNPNPIVQFGQWFEEAKKNAGLSMPEAMMLATLDDNGYPDIRTVLLKGFDENGFVFFTNFNSSKGRALKKNPVAALNFYWEKLKKQVRIKGKVSVVSDAEADEYFRSRPLDSQIGAWASLQSEVLDSRDTLEKRFKEFSEKFKGKEIPRPPHWSGFRVNPSKIEFWIEQPYRLHDRFVYRKNEKGEWVVGRLYP